MLPETRCLSNDHELETVLLQMAESGTAVRVDAPTSVAQRPLAQVDNTHFRFEAQTPRVAASKPSVFAKLITQLRSLALQDEFLLSLYE